MTDNHGSDENTSLLEDENQEPIFSTQPNEFLNNDTDEVPASDDTESEAVVDEIPSSAPNGPEEILTMEDSNTRGYVYAPDHKKRTYAEIANQDQVAAAKVAASGKADSFHMNLRHRSRPVVEPKRTRVTRSRPKRAQGSDYDGDEDLQHDDQQPIGPLDSTTLEAEQIKSKSGSVSSDHNNDDMEIENVTSDFEHTAETVADEPFQSQSRTESPTGSTSNEETNSSLSALITAELSKETSGLLFGHGTASGNLNGQPVPVIVSQAMAAKIENFETNNDIAEDEEIEFATEPCIIGMHQEYFFGVGFTDKSIRATSKCIVGLCGLHLKFMYGLQEADTKLGNSVIGPFNTPNEFKNRGTSLFAFIPSNTRRGECEAAFNVADIVVPTAAAGKMLMEKVTLSMKTQYLREIYETLSITEDEVLVKGEKGAGNGADTEEIKVPSITEPKWLHDVLKDPTKLVFNMSRPMRAFFQRQADGRKAFDNQRLRQVKMWDDSIAPSENYNSLVEEAKLHGEISTNRKIHEFYLQTHMQEDPDFPKVLTTLNIAGVSQNVTRKFSYRCLVAHGERFAYQRMFQYLFEDILVSKDQIAKISGIVLNAIRGCDVPVKHPTGVHIFAVNAPNVVFVSGIGIVAIKKIMKDEELVLLTGDPTSDKFVATGIEPDKYAKLRVTYRSPTVACKPTNVLKSTSQIVDIPIPSAFSGYADRDIVI